MSKVFTDSKIIDDLHEYEPYKYEPSYMDAEAVLLETPTPGRAKHYHWEAEASAEMDRQAERAARRAACVDWLLVGPIIGGAIYFVIHVVKTLIQVLAGG